MDKMSRESAHVVKKKPGRKRVNRGKPRKVRKRRGSSTSSIRSRISRALSRSRSRRSSSSRTTGRTRSSSTRGSTGSSKSYSPRTRRSKSSTQSKRKAKQRQERDVEQNLVNMVEERRKIWQFWRNVNVAPLTQFFLTVDPLAWSVFSLVACGFVKIMFACFIFSMLLHSHDAPLVYLMCFLIIHIISVFATLEMLLIQKKKMLLICGSVDAAVIIVMIIVLTFISSTKNGEDIVPVERVAGITVVVAFTEILLIVRYYYMRYRAPIQNKGMMSACPPSIPPGCPPSLPCSRTQSSKTPGNGSKSEPAQSAPTRRHTNHHRPENCPYRSSGVPHLSVEQEVDASGVPTRTHRRAFLEVATAISPKPEGGSVEDPTARDSSE